MNLYVRILIYSKKCWKIQLQRYLLLSCHPVFRSTLFSFKPATFFCNFGVLITIIILAYFCFFTKLYYLKMSFEYYNAFQFHFVGCLFEGNFIQTLLIQPKMYLFTFLKWQQKWARILLSYFVSSCRDLISFDVILTLFCSCGRLE